MLRLRSFVSSPAGFRYAVELLSLTLKAPTIRSQVLVNGLGIRPWSARISAKPPCATYQRQMRNGALNRVYFACPIVAKAMRLTLSTDASSLRDQWLVVYCNQRPLVSDVQHVAARRGPAAGSSAH